MLRVILFEYSRLSDVRTITSRTPGLVIKLAGTVVNSCCALTKRVGISRPSSTILTAGVNLSPLTCKVKSPGVRAYTVAGESPEATNGGVGVGGGGEGTGVGLGVGDGGM